MDFHEAWGLALKKTDIIRSRVALLQTFDDTQVPYILLSPSSVTEGDTVVRRGRVSVQRPALILPPNIPRFEGFEFEKGALGADDQMANFLLIRGISIPSLKYNNQTHSLDIFEGDVSRASSYYANQLEREEDVLTGLMVGHEEVWPFSLLIFICSQVARNTGTDIRRLMDEHHRQEGA